MAVLKSPSKFALLLGGSAMAEMLYAVAMGLCLRSLGLDMPYTSILVVTLFVRFVSGVSPIPGGVGIAEAGLTAGLVAIGVPVEFAFSAAMIYRLCTFYVPPGVRLGGARRAAEEGVPVSDPDPRRHPLPRVRVSLFRRPNFAGLVVALLFWWESLIPSMLPRSCARRRRPSARCASPSGTASARCSATGSTCCCVATTRNRSRPVKRPAWIALGVARADRDRRRIWRCGRVGRTTSGRSSASTRNRRRD